MITNEIKMTISYNTHDAEKNTKAVTSSPLDLSKYSSWEEIREELVKQGFDIDEYDNDLVVEDLYDIYDKISYFEQWHPKRVFNLFNTAGILKDSSRFSRMETVAEIYGIDEFVDRVELRGEEWDAGIYVYEGYDWYDFGKEMCEFLGYRVHKELEPYVNYAFYGISYANKNEVFKYSNGIVEFVF